MAASLNTTLVSAGMSPYLRRAGAKNRSETRALYLSQPVQKMMENKNNQIGSQQMAGIFARLNRFVEGASLTVSTSSVGDARGEVKALKGYDNKLFEIRFYDVAPQYRMLGVFPQKDIFLVFQMALRSDLDKNWSKICGRIVNQLVAMGKNSPECLTSDNMDLVLSNWRPSK